MYTPLADANIDARSSSYVLPVADIEFLLRDEMRATRFAQVVLFDRAYWRRIIDFTALVETGMVCAEDRALFEHADTPEEASRIIELRRLRAHV